MNGKLKSQRGVSLIGAILVLIILGIFGALIVTLVSTEQSVRISQLSRNWAFYNVQAGLEYALKEIDSGGYPEVTNKAFGQGTFTVNVNYSEAGDDTIIVTGNVGIFEQQHQIEYDSFGADCLSVNKEVATLTGPGKTQLKGMTLRRDCNQAITIDKLIISWVADGGERLTLVNIKNNVVWQDPVGVPSGTLIDINDVSLAGSVAHQVHMIEFDSNMLHKTLTIQFIMSDTSSSTISFELLPPNQN